MREMTNFSLYKISHFCKGEGGGGVLALLIAFWGLTLSCNPWEAGESKGPPGWQGNSGPAHPALHTLKDGYSICWHRSCSESLLQRLFSPETPDQKLGADICPSGTDPGSVSSASGSLAMLCL